MLPENLKEQETLTELPMMRTRKELFKGFIRTLEKQDGLLESDVQVVVSRWGMIWQLQWKRVHLIL